MKKLLSLTLLTGSFALSAFAQDNHFCGSDLRRKALEAAKPERLEEYRIQRSSLYQEAEMLATASAKTTASDTVPVVFHIILNAAQIAQLGGIAGIESRIASQIEVLNQDFNRLNPDSTGIPAGFKPVYGNAGIRFALAHQSPTGAATPGYEIIPTAAVSADTTGIDAGSTFNFPDARYYTSGSAVSWNYNDYLNIWIVNPKDGGFSMDLLGIATPPSDLSWGTDPNELGVLLNYKCFGRKTPPYTYYPISGIDGGRTLTHELGHFFEIWHIWGEDDGCPDGTWGSDDDIADTPPQASEHYGNPTFPKFDACSPSGNGTMFMNFMDYVDDNSMHLFTKGQAEVMQASILGESSGLTNNPWVLQYPTSIKDIAETVGFTLSPNPARNNTPIVLRFNASVARALQHVSVVSINGAVVAVYTAADLQGETITINTGNMAQGIYYIRCITLDGTTTKKVSLH